MFKMTRRKGKRLDDLKAKGGPTRKIRLERKMPLWNKASRVFLSNLRVSKSSMDPPAVGAGSC